MIQRYLEDNWFEPAPPAFLEAIAEDPELQVEIRQNSLTVYYRGAALIRNLRFNDGQIGGEIHYKYIPLIQPNASDYVSVSLQDEGFVLDREIRPLPLGNLSKEVISEYQRMMVSVAKNLELAIVHKIVCYNSNRIIDQEISFGGVNKIDICNYDLGANCLSMVEVKGIHDPRLRSNGDNVPEVVEQLSRYQRIIEEESDYIIEAFQKVIALKQRLGLVGQLDQVPAGERLRLMKKPILVIGGCTGAEIQQILNAESWRPLMDGLRDHAAAVLLCANIGRSLQWNSHNKRKQGRGFDDSTFG